MEQIKIEEAQTLSAPNPFCLITVLKEDDTTNLTAASWWTYVSNHPPTLCVCLSRKGYTNELIHKSKQFSVCLVDASIAEQAIKCGYFSGRKVHKADEFGIELMSAETIKAAIVKKSKLIFECQLVDIVNVKDHDLFIGEITAIQADRLAKQAYALNGYREIGSLQELS